MGATAQVAMVFSVVDRSPAHAGGNGQDDQAVTPLDDGPEPAPDLRALHRKRFHLLVAGVVFVGGGALVELLTGGPVVVARGRSRRRSLRRRRGHRRGPQGAVAATLTGARRRPLRQGSPAGPRVPNVDGMVFGTMTRW